MSNSRCAPPSSTILHQFPDASPTGHSVNLLEMSADRLAEFQVLRGQIQREVQCLVSVNEVGASEGHVGDSLVGHQGFLSPHRGPVRTWKSSAPQLCSSGSSCAAPVSGTGPPRRLLTFSFTRALRLPHRVGVLSLWKGLLALTRRALHSSGRLRDLGWRVSAWKSSQGEGLGS